MKKNELKTRLIIAQGELEADLENENGCFDEIANNIFMLALGCEEILDKSSEDLLIQLDNSVHIIHCDEQEYIDGIYLNGATTDVLFTASSFDGSEIYRYRIEEIDRYDIVKVIKELYKMCEL